MTGKASYHAHTTFCDGKATPEEMVKAAIERGMEAIALTAHAAWPFATEWHLSPKDYGAYLAEARRLKSEYAGRIDVWVGFEADYLAGLTAPDPSTYAPVDPEFLIGSVHYVTKGASPLAGSPWSIDAPTAEVARGLESAYGGNAKKAVKAYYETVREMVATCSFDALGHVDVIRKRNGELRFFDEDASWYRAELRKTARVIARAGVVVEINTGGIARGAIDDVYPSRDMLRFLAREGVPITVSSDSHNTRDIDCAYDRAYEAAREAGYRSLALFTGTGWKEAPIPR